MTAPRDLRRPAYPATVIDRAERRRMTPDHVEVEAAMIAREEVLAMPETTATATATAAGTVAWPTASPPATATTTATAAGTVSWSFASPTPATPPASTSSAATMDVVPGPMIVVQRYEYTGRELAAESSGYYFRYRVYGPALGQFFTRDHSYIDGMSLYSGVFALYHLTDPSGNMVPWEELGNGTVEQTENIVFEFDQRKQPYESMTYGVVFPGWGAWVDGEAIPGSPCCCRFTVRQVSVRLMGFWQSYTSNTLFDPTTVKHEQYHRSQSLAVLKKFARGLSPKGTCCYKQGPTAWAQELADLDYPSSSCVATTSFCRKRARVLQRALGAVGKSYGKSVADEFDNKAMKFKDWLRLSPEQSRALQDQANGSAMYLLDNLAMRDWDCRDTMTIWNAFGLGLE